MVLYRESTEAGGIFISHSILRIERVKTNSDITGIQKHVQRETENYANKDIDKSRTHLNYDLINNTAINFNERVKKRIENGYAGKRKVRNDAIKLVDGIITSDNAFFEELSNLDKKDFFSHALEFAENEFGSENIMYATVHLDEETPHMHFGFVPLTEDGRLSAKEVIGNKKQMSALQDKFNDFVNEKGYRMQRGESSFVSKRKHLETSEFKNETKYHEKELVSVKRELSHEFKRLESLNSIAPEISTKRLEEKKKALPEPIPVEVNKLRMVDPVKLTNLNNLAIKLADIAESSQNELVEKDILIEELTSLNKQLNENVRNQAIREENLVSDAITKESAKYSVLQAKYEDLTNHIEGAAEDLRDEKSVQLERSFEYLKQGYKKIEVENSKLTKDKNELHSENKRLETENNSLRDKYNQSLELIEDYKIKLESAYHVTKEYIKSLVPQQFERVFNYFRVDYDEDLKKCFDSELPGDDLNDFEKHVLIDKDPELISHEKDIYELKKLVDKERRPSRNKDHELDM